MDIASGIAVAVTVRSLDLPCLVKVRSGSICAANAWVSSMYLRSTLAWARTGRIYSSSAGIVPSTLHLLPTFQGRPLSANEGPSSKAPSSFRVFAHTSPGYDMAAPSRSRHMSHGVYYWRAPWRTFISVQSEDIPTLISNHGKTPSLCPVQLQRAFGG